MVKTAPFSTRLEYLSMSFYQIKLVTLSTLLLVLLASCSTPVKAPDSKVITGIEEIILEPSTPSALSASQRVELAKTLTGNVAIEELITATKLFFQQQNYAKSLWLADKILPLVDDSIPDYTQEQLQLITIKASCLQHLGYYPESYIQLEQLAQFARTNKIPLSASYYRLLSAAFTEKKRPISSLNAQLFAFSLTDPSVQSKKQVDELWQNFQNLSQWQLNLLATEKAPDSEGWLQLTAIASKFGGNHTQLQYHLSIWQRKFKRHPAKIIAAQLTTDTITPLPIQNIAVILPLTGKQHSAGLAIQQGILASYASDKTKTLHFLDSNTLNWYGLTNEFSTFNIDYVIGPLLKANVDKYITHTSLHNQSLNDYMLSTVAGLFDPTLGNSAASSTTVNSAQAPDSITAIDSDSAIQGYLQPTGNSQSIPTLLLNIPEKASLNAHHTALSMRPEDEASQAAATLSRKNFKHPIVLSQENIVSKRIAQAFVQQWYRITGDTIEVVYYSTDAQMQANIKASLSVDKSKSRIDKLKSQLNQRIRTQTRNRRDIDMIYIVGTPGNTRLAKPYIEVNISPFAEIIPVFASSRSHSTRIDYSSNSDLKGLKFTEIPWLLPNKKHAELASLSQQLWPKRSDGLSRLFAMGFDSYQLISKIPQMQQAPYLQHWGQTGVLKLDKNRLLTRSLLWGEYKYNKVVSIAME